MSRKRNRTRRPNGHGNNRWGPGTVGFDGDHPMQGVDPPPTNRNPANRRGGQSFPARGRGAQPYRNSNNNRGSGRGGGQAQRNNHNQNNAPNPNVNKRKRRNNNHNNNSNNNNNNAPSGSSDQSSNSDIRLTTPPPLPFAGPLFPSTTSSPFSSLHNNTNPHHSHNDGHGRGGGGGSRSRFCTECSAVRRANIRFRNWASHALRVCNERFREWADDAGVGFESADEMDWQPEPVTRVLIVGSAVPTFPSNPNFPPPHPQFHLPNTHLGPNPNPNLNPGGNPKFGSAEAEQYLEFLKQNAGRGDLLCPGPWPWPPYVDPNQNSTISAFSARVPSTGLPKLPTTLEDVPVPDVSSVHINSNTNTNASPNPNPNPNFYTNASNFSFNSSIGNPTPVSGFGMLGAGVMGCAGCAAEEREARLGTVEQPTVPAWEPPQMPAVTSTCGPTRVGVPSTRPLGQNFAAYRGRSASRDSEGLY